MDSSNRGDPVEEAFRRARLGDRNAFAAWMSKVEIPLRRSFSRWARAVDVEVVIQETFLRMWLLACDPQRPLEGSHASLKYAFGVARNVALEEIRRYRQDRFVDLSALESLPEGRCEADPPDPALARAIAECMDRLPAKPRSAMWARVRGACLPDRELAKGLKMKVNTFLQNIVRARRLLRRCLEQRGVRLGEILS